MLKKNKMEKTIEHLGILQGVSNYIFETQRVGERPYGSTTQPALLLKCSKSILNWRSFTWSRKMMKQNAII